MLIDGLSFSERVLPELEQSSDEGRDVRQFEEEARAIAASLSAGLLRETEAKNLLDRILAVPVKSGYPYVEPDDLPSIRLGRPEGRNAAPVKPDYEAFFDKAYGAWLGRCAGCLLGQPVEGWKHKRLTGFLKDTGNYPVTRYLSSDLDEEIRSRYSVQDFDNNTWSPYVRWINMVPPYGPEDDDTNYTTFYLKLVEEKGFDFTSEDAARYWLTYLSCFRVFTAERIAYQNLVNLVPPPLSGSRYNPYREWVGAQIRADFFGYVSPGNPEKAAELAWRDGRVSGTKNGIYGEMFCAAMIARAAVSSDIKDIVVSGLGEIPGKSRLAEGVGKVLDWYDQRISWEEAANRFYAIYDDNKAHHAVHVISNAMICVMALLWGEGDFEKTAGFAVSAGFDTDCNGATVGSIAGMVIGAEGLPGKWTAPLHGKLKSGISGFDLIDISKLAERTVKLARLLGGCPH
jgi:ADP-ribosylglycohydrolase